MKSKMTKEQFKEWAKERGWQEDQWGHFQKTVGDREYRFKISKTHVRYEVKVRYDEGGSDWVRVRGGYFKDLSIGPNGKLMGLKGE